MDVIQVTDEAGLFGRTHINIIRPEDVTAAGKANIIAGAKASDDPVWAATDFLADKAYRTLLHRGLSKPNIQYLSFEPEQDVDGDGIATNDIYGASTLANATNSFTAFASGANKLLVYLVDHGSDSAGQGFMRLNPSSMLTAAQLDGWLDALEAGDTGLHVTVVMDFCYAGSFLDELAGSSNRTLIAATADGELTYFIAGGLVSFSDAFFTALQLGYDVNNAFLVGRQAMSAYQFAGLDDDGDGVYAPGIDGAESGFPVGATLVAGLDVPQVGEVSPNQIITNGTEVTLWADTISSVYPIERVWCVIVSPSHQPDTSAGIPVLDIPELDLLPDSVNPGRYQATFDGLTEAGTYKVMFFAQDIWGGVSISKQSYINQGGFLEQAIVVAGGPVSEPGWSSIDFIARTAYETLRSRRFEHGDLYYLSAAGTQDVDGDGTNDVDGLPTLEAVSNAIANWATSADRLTLYLVGRGTNNTVQLDTGVYLDGRALDGWLDAFQMTDRSVNLVLEFAGSGGFATNLPPPLNRERISIASTRPLRASLMDDGGLVSFSQYFLAEIFGGKTIGEASTRARKAIRRASGALRQRAGIDDSGNGQLNEKNLDGQVAGQRYIGAAFATGDDSPHIAAVIPVSTLGEGESQLTLWAAQITDVDGISNVWCTITPPDYDGASALPRVELSWAPGPARYEALYSGFTAPGPYTLTFYASDTKGEISPAVQSEVIKPDAYEEDNTLLHARPFDIARAYQLHTFHTPTDTDWVRFYALSEYVYDIETFHFSTNIDTVLDLYRQEADGTLTHVDHLDEFGFDEGELTGLDFPQDGIYYLQVSQFQTNGSGPGSYELVIQIPAGDGVFLVIGYNLLTGGPLPLGSYASINGVPYPFAENGAPTNRVDPLYPGGQYTVEVVVAQSGYLPLDDPHQQGAVLDVGNAAYGNPRRAQTTQVDTGLALTNGYLAFGFWPYVEVAGTVRDAWTGERLGGAGLQVAAQSGFFSSTNGYLFEGYPFYATYQSDWSSGTMGAFPSDMRFPAGAADLAIALAGYSNRLLHSAVGAVSPGDRIDLGLVDLYPLDANSNAVGDAWEVLYFPGQTNVSPQADADGDGHLNREEYLLGTDPTDALDLFAAEQITNAAGITITWPVKSGRVYRTLVTEDLATNAWSLGGGPWTATTAATTMQWTDTNAVGTQGRCYRVDVLAP